ncbi:hypothetical protein SDRG_03679 [Saprolegnia diclina VS20]|uniref:DUF6604 domain-containing protein n=1 Tax=Saprolegnia diclina (strain VS20) TaxID=1156394 RepID=T0QKX3_SAPDV|nr:hypothetical protein SDRG_03679 [Saprolegnia diclina VS20]EQC38714.1 hypothetical protein SDRG_03679 [Saprolegnia diclina VS20]|eukprot:XP_008607538.1 hypothetical protein SDRG_03679 [Saprolegnia diclina VS20]
MPIFDLYKAATDAVLKGLQKASGAKKAKAAAWTTGHIYAAALACQHTAFALLPRASAPAGARRGHCRVTRVTCFLNLLRAIQARLAPLATTRRRSPRLDIAFDALVIDDDDKDNDGNDDDHDDMPPFDVAQYTVPAASPTPDEAARDARLADYEAAQFRAACCFMDMDELMSDVVAAWTAVKQQQSSLVAATAVTNHCVRVADALASELTLELPFLTQLGAMSFLADNSEALRTLVLEHAVPLAEAVAFINTLQHNLAKPEPIPNHEAEKVASTSLGVPRRTPPPSWPLCGATPGRTLRDWHGRAISTTSSRSSAGSFLAPTGST